MNILVHLPTKGRKQLAEMTIAGYRGFASDPSHIRFHAACNSPEDVPENCTTSIVHPFRSKIEAYNAIPNDPWDIVVAASDDMWCVHSGWDTIISEAMQEHFPELDGCLWFSDGRQGAFLPRKFDRDPICTLSIMGRMAFYRMGYIYHPSYHSFYCDNEWTDVWDQRGALYKDPRCLFLNQHPVWGGVMPNDDVYREKSRDFKRDERNYYQRKRKGFPQ